MQRVVFSPIAVIGSSVCVRACVCGENGLETSTFFHHLVGHKKVIQHSSTLQLITLIYCLKVKDLNQDHFERLDVVISQKVTVRVNITVVTCRRLLTGIRKVYIHLILAHSKGRNPGHFELLITRERCKIGQKYCYCQFIESHLLAFVSCNYI